MSGSFAAILPVELPSNDHALALELADSTRAFGNHHIFAAQPPQFQEVKLTSIQLNTHFRLSSVSSSTFSSLNCCSNFLLYEARIQI
jgi:hypothetical protein